jgi:membrane protease YdiL (CAAX protease family)
MMQVEILTALFSYLGLRVIYPQQLDALHSYASYFFELAIVIWAIVRMSSKSEFRFNPSRRMVSLTLLLALAGWLAHFGATTTGLTILFDASSFETRLFLLAVAPILEEMLFRQTFWKQFEAFRIPKAGVWILTSAFFSFAHLNAIRFAPPELFTFIYYQTGYTLLLGLACGWIRQKDGSVVSAILLHAAFNIGFFLGMIG